MQELARYTIEVPRPEGNWAAMEAATARARQAADELRQEGTPIRFLRSIYVPEDETCFFLYEGPGADAVRAAARRAALTFDDIQKTIALEPEEEK